MSDDQPATKEIPYECTMGIHAYIEIETLDSDGPMTVVCSNCNRTWRVMVEDRPGSR